jgi:hypothetical protein
MNFKKLDQDEIYKLYESMKYKNYPNDYSEKNREDGEFTLLYTTK